METKTHISVVLFALFNAVIFGAGLLITLGIAESALGTAIGIVLSAVAAIVAGAILGLVYAPRVRNRYWQNRDETPKPVWE